jgi:hypothetical protein
MHEKVCEVTVALVKKKNAYFVCVRKLIAVDMAGLYLSDEQV